MAVTAAERAARLPGDDLVDPADVVMDRGISLPAPPGEVWPWVAQLGKGRGGWYLPALLERAVPPSRRGLRHVEPRLTRLAVGDVVPDWGGSFTVAAIRAPAYLVYVSERGHTRFSWALQLTAVPTGTRLHLRLRMAPVKHRRLAEYGGGLVDVATIAGLAAGLRERVQPTSSTASAGGS